MNPNEREELPEVDMDAVRAERKQIAAGAYPNNDGNYRRRVRPGPAPVVWANRDVEPARAVRRMRPGYAAVIAALAMMGGGFPAYREGR